MKFTYKDLVALTERYNTLLQANNFDVLCYVSGEAMFAEEVIIEDSKETKAFWQYFKGDSFIVDTVTTAKKYEVPISKLIEKCIEKFAGEVNQEKETKGFQQVFANIQFAPAKQGQQRAILLLNQINELFRQWDYGLYAYMDGQKLAELEMCHAPSYELVVTMLEWLVEQTVKENQIPLVYARVHCCKTRWQELGLPCCMEIREYQNMFLKKNMKFLTVSLTNFILRQGAKCYFEFSEYQVETLEYDAAKLYHWLMATGKKMRAVPKGKMTFWFSYQTYLDESKDKLLSVLRLEPNVLGSAKYYIEKNEADYKFILGVLKEMKQTATVSREASSASEEETQASEQEDKYGDVLRSIQTKLDDVLNVVIENSVLTMDGLEMVNTNVEMVNVSVQGVAESLEETRKTFLIKFDELQNGLEQCMEKKDTEGLCALLEKKIILIKELHEKDAPDVAVGEDIYFLLAFLHTEKAEELITELFSYLQTGAYKTQYEEKISEENTILYSAECNLGKVMVYRKDGVTYLKNLQIKQQYLQENLVAFLEKYSIKTSSQVFFDNQIYEELDRLMKGTKQSFHMVMPWVKDWRLNTYEARFGKMIQSGVDVHIKYGYLSKGSDEAQNRINEQKLVESKKALETLNESLGKRFGGQIQVKEDDTHIKAAVVDGRWCFVGSCNMLSYHYDYHKNPDYRHEMMVLLEDEELAQVLMKYCEGTIHDVK